MPVNEGANGFHLYTVVTDGYGNYIAEDSNGKELARVPARSEDGSRFAKDMKALAKQLPSK